MPTLEDLRIHLYADGADYDTMLRLATHPYVRGFTTNPSLMRAAGVREYEGFAQTLLAAIPHLPISFEVIGDTYAEMERQARRIATWRPTNVYVKIPVTNSEGLTSFGVIRRLTLTGVCVNVTAVFTLQQVAGLRWVLENGAPAIVSIFAGRIADTGRNPVPLVEAAVELLRPYPNVQVLWASTREVYNIVQADQAGAHIITVTPDILTKLALVGKSLEGYSRETVCQFYHDALKAGYTL